MRKLLLLLGLLYPFIALSIDINVGIYASESLKTIVLSPKTGKYILIGDGKFIDTVTSSNIYEIKVVDTLLEIKTLNGELGKFSSLYLKEYNPDCSFNIKSMADKTARLYNDELKVAYSNGYLKMFNIVDFEHYIAGVVECEAGQRRPVEFYKAQAVICRTYALRNLARHIDEDYELCDAIHCQVYKGTADVPAILQAVKDTKGLVLADSSKHLINAAYHSNCGGYTVNSEDVWSRATPCLKAIKDTFCLHQLHATWEKHFTWKDWTNYLSQKEATLIRDSSHDASYWDSIPTYKRIYFYDAGFLIPLKEMRLDLNLHSTYFKIEKSGDGTIVLKGRGNGHRVGLCQEGAIQMAQCGYNYLQILHTYYQGIQLINSDELTPAEGTN